MNIKQNYTKQSFLQLRHNKKGKDKYPVVGPPYSMVGHHMLCWAPAIPDGKTPER